MNSEKLQNIIRDFPNIKSINDKINHIKKYNNSWFMYRKIIVIT